jgi:holliday junction DNA helicase RuvB
MDILLMLALYFWGRHMLAKEQKKAEARAAAKTEDNAEVVDNLKRDVVPFNPGEPRTWDEYKGQLNAKRMLQLSIATLHDEVNQRPRLMFVASKGQGKSALARVYANQFLDAWRRGHEHRGVEFHGKYIEITPAMVSNKKELDDVICSIEPFDVVFIDEIHMLDRKTADTLLPALQENRYPTTNGMIDLPKRFCWLGATTDVGLLPEAFQDRFQLIQLQPLQVDDLVEIINLQTMPTEERAAWEIADRSAGYPREVKRVYAEARKIAVVNNHPLIKINHARTAFDMLGLDQYGLYPDDRRVLSALFDRPKQYARRRDGAIPIKYAQSERTIRTITGFDEDYYRGIEAKLLRLDFLTIGTAGRELTSKAKSIYYPGAVEYV